MRSSEVTASKGILHYQKNRTLDRCTGFVASVQVEDRDGRRYFAGLRADGLEIYTVNDRQYFYDLEGRLLRASTPDDYRVRGVSHRGILNRKRPLAEGGGFERRELSADELAAACHEGWVEGKQFHAALKHPAAVNHAAPGLAEALSAIRPIVAAIETFTPERMAAESDRFAEVYQPVPVLPPDHYGSLVLQATEGCSFDTCTFCNLYKGIPFRVRTPERFEQHLLAALAFHGEGLRRYTQIFLGQANALAMPQSRLVPILECIGRHLKLPASDMQPARPSWAHGHRTRFLGIGSFLDGFTGLTKSTDDYAQLRRLGLTRVYLGVESGSSTLLKWLEKPASSGEMQETLRRIKQAGLQADIILLVGAGGARFAEEHVRQSLEFVTKSALTKGDRVYLSFIREYDDSTYSQRMTAEGIHRLDGTALRRQYDELARGIRAHGLQAVPYRVDPFIY